jgi:N-acetylglucosamine-6-phosphate deacetylase
MLRHQKHHRTQYEYTLTDSSGTVVYTLWTMSKSVNKVIRLASDRLENICKYTNTQPADWLTCKTGIENSKAGITGKFTGETLLGARGYAEERKS